MRYGILAVVLAVAVYVFLCGCGTILNLREGEHKVYGGARFDAEAATVGLTQGIIQAASPDTSPRESYAVLQIMLGVASWIDLPFTLVGDTLTLPWIVTTELKRFVESHDRPEK